jgi:hypothetical protein
MRLTCIDRLPTPKADHVQPLYAALLTRIDSTTTRTTLPS